LKGRSLKELRERGAQAARACAEQSGLSALARIPGDAPFFSLIDATQLDAATISAENLLDHLRTRRQPRFFPGFDEGEDALAELRRRFGARAEEWVVERADRIVEGRFDLLGWRDLRFGDPIDWHLEPVSGKSAPLKHWSRIDYLNADVVGDKKIIWELNRHQYFLTLGRAYRYTGDERYAKTFVEHLDAWMDGNPPKLGINWASSLEVSFRAISWLWALQFFKDSKHLTAPVFLRALKFLYISARHLETYPSTYFAPNTHLTGEALGLFYLGTLLPEFDCAARWRATGRRILLAELERQVHPDGVYFEQTSYYHRYTTDFYIHLYILSQANDEPIEDALKEKLEAMLDLLMSITRPDGTTPFFGDDDGGRFLMLDERATNDFRSTLSTGAALFNRPDYKYVAKEGSEETFWLLGRAGLRAFDDLDARTPSINSRAFTDGGYYVMRDGWHGSSNYMLIDSGPHGAVNGAHGHADALSFELAARGRTLLVDPGTGTYTGASEMRDYFRATASHNELLVDDESSSVPGGPFSWKSVARASMLAWISRERFDYFEGEHDGYMRLAAPAMRTRSVLFLKGDYWVIYDRVATHGAHRYDLRFHFAAGTNPAIVTDDETPMVRERENGAAGLEMFAFGGGGQWKMERGWVSPCYGERRPAPVLSFSATGTEAQEFVTFLVPRSAQSPGARVREVRAANGRAFEFYDGEARDLLMIGDGRRLQSSEIASDFEWTWMRLTPMTGTPEEIVLLNGRQLNFDGREIFSAAHPVGYVSARRVGDELLVETEAGGAFTIASLGAARVVLNGQQYPSRADGTLKFLNGRLLVENIERAELERLV
jgi:hypothetical protein